MQSVEKNGVRYMYTAPYHPASNGRAERMVRELKCALRKQSQGTVACKVSRFLFKQHSTPHSETGRTPAELMLGRSFRSVLSRLHLDMISPGCIKPPSSRELLHGDPVYVRNFSRGPKWLASRILRRLGHVMYRLQMVQYTGVIATTCGEHGMLYR